MLVRAGNPHKLDGYRSIAERENVQLAVIRDQIQHLSAMEFGVPSDRIFVFETYHQAAAAVREGHVDVYVSVARAHIGFMAQNPDWRVEIVPVPMTEKQPAFGSFAFALNDVKLRCAVDEILAPFLGCAEHRDMVRGFGMRDAEVDLIMDVKP